MAPEVDASWPPWLIVIVVVLPVAITVMGTVLVAHINRQGRIQKEQQSKIKEVHDHVVNSHQGANLRDDVDSIKSTLSVLSLQIQDLKLQNKTFTESLNVRYDAQRESLANAVKRGKQDQAQAIEAAVRTAVDQRREEQTDAIERAMNKHVLDCPLRNRKED